jgi:ferrochelatase
MNGRIGVVVMSYGSPGRPEDVEAFYTDVRRGRPPSPEQLADLERRYDAIGGTSGLAGRTLAQARALEAALQGEHPGRYRVFAGAKHSAPFIEDAVSAVAASGLASAVGIVLAPHFSRLSVGEYRARAERAAAAQCPPVSMAVVDSWHLEPGLVELLAERVASALDRLPGDRRRDAVVVFSAHSLPARILDDADPYPDQLRETAEAVSERAGLRRTELAWQSAGRTPEPWLGPDLGEVIARLGAEGAPAVVVCPAGFTADHLEILYDIDIEARRAAEQAGMAFARSESLNDDPRLAAVLAAVVERTARARL